MRRLVRLLLILAVVLAALEPAAHACTNATQLSTDAYVAMLHEAEDALAAGNLPRAVDLANTVLANRHGGPEDSLPLREPLSGRADRILALAWTRDGSSGPALREHAREMLLERRRARGEDPESDADYAEALSRSVDARDRAQAFDLLTPLVEVCRGPRRARLRLRAREFPGLDQRRPAPRHWPDLHRRAARVLRRGAAGQGHRLRDASGVGPYREAAPARCALLRAALRGDARARERSDVREAPRRAVLGAIFQLF